MEFPTHPSRRQRRQQQAVSAVIRGLQDITLEVSPERLDVLAGAEPELYSDEPGFNWATFMGYMRDAIDDNGAPS